MKANYETLLDALTNEMQALHKELQECKEKLSQEPCEDVVSRQAVLDLPRIKTHNVWGNVIYESVDVENVRQLPSVTPMQKWIPCSERLPEEHKEVLTCSLGGFIEIQSYEDGCGGYWENQKGDWTDLEEVTHWMQLPTPPNQPEIPTGAEGSDKE